MSPLYLVTCIINAGGYEYTQTAFTNHPPADPYQWCLNQFTHHQDHERIFDVEVTKIEHINDLRRALSLPDPEHMASLYIANYGIS